MRTRLQGNAQGHFRKYAEKQSKFVSILVPTFFCSLVFYNTYLPPAMNKFLHQNKLFPTNFLKYPLIHYKMEDRMEEIWLGKEEVGAFRS